MSAKKKVLENSFLYTFSQLIIKATGFLLLPLYTFFLTPEDYGIVNLIDSFLQMALYIVSMSLGSGIVRFYVDYKYNQTMLKRYLGSVVIFVAASSFLFTMIAFIFKDLLINSFFDGLAFYPYILIALITMSFLTLHKIHQNIIQAMQVGRKLTSINMITFFSIACLNVFFIVVLRYGATGMLLAQMIVHIGYLFYMMYDLRKNNLFTFAFDIPILWSALKYSIPLMPHNLSTRIASFASRAFLNIGSTVATVGLYSVGLRFGQLIDTVQSSVNKAFRPWFFEMMEKGESANKKEIVQLSSLLLTLYSLVYMVIGLFSQEAILIMTSDKYVMAWTVIPILVVGYSVKSIYYFYVNILFYYKSLAKKIFLSTLAGSFADIILAFILIKFLGMYGAALAFLLAKIIVVLIVYLLAKGYNTVGYNIINMSKIIVTSLIFMGVGLIFSYNIYLTSFSFLNFFYKIFILFMYALYLYVKNKNYINHLFKTQFFKNIIKKIKK